MENDLLVLELSSIGSGLRALQMLENSISASGLNAGSRLKLIDAEPVGGRRFLILARGSAAALRTFARASSDRVDFEVIEAIDQAVLDAVYSLAPNTVGDAVVVVETESVSSMLALANAFSQKHHLRAIEIRIRKSGEGGAYAYFTGASVDCLSATEDARAQLSDQNRRGTVDLIDKPGSFIRSLFGG